MGCAKPLDQGCRGRAGGCDCSLCQHHSVKAERSEQYEVTAVFAGHYNRHAGRFRVGRDPFSAEPVFLSGSASPRANLMATLSAAHKQPASLCGSRQKLTFATQTKRPRQLSLAGPFIVSGDCVIQLLWHYRHGTGCKRRRPAGEPCRSLAGQPVQASDPDDHNGWSAAVEQSSSRR